MDLNDLHIFRSVARYGSMTKTAIALNYVQSNVSFRIRQLEKSLRTQLFYRHRSGVTLTPAGKTLLDYADRIHLLLSEAERAVQNEQDPQGPLVIGTTESTAYAHLPAILADYHAKYPDVNIFLVAEPTESLVNKVLKKEVEAAFVAGTVTHPDIIQAEIFAEELVFAAGPLHPPIHSFSDLYGTRLFLFNAGCVYRAKLDVWLQEEGIFPPNITVLESLDTIISYVKSNLGVCILGKTFAEEYQKNHVVRYYGIQKQDNVVTTSFIFHKAGVMTAALKAFIDNLQKFKAAAPSWSAMKPPLA